VTALQALKSGEVDAWENLPNDYVAPLQHDADVTINDRSGFVGTMRFNWLQPPFDNVKMRQAVLQVVNQSDYMAAMAGDPQNWRTCYSVYACLGSEETRGSDALSGPRDYDKAKKLVAEAGYKGEPVVLLDPADIPQLHAEAAVTADLLQKRLGLNVEVATTEWGTVIKRIYSKNPVAQGGWNVFVKGIPGELRSTREQGEPARWIADPVGLRRVCQLAVRKLIALPASTPSIRLLGDQTAELLAGISHTLNGLALLLADPARPIPRRWRMRLRVADWLPALVNAGRAFVAIGAVELFWIITEWPNGAEAIAFAAIGVILFAPQADQAYATAIGFTIGTSLAAAFAAIIAFAVLPNLETFPAFSLAIGLVLVPAGVGMAQPWQRAMFTAITANFVPLLAPANQMSYDTQQFYNAALAIVTGVGAAGLRFA
jgi:hypothetical protein